MVLGPKTEYLGLAHFFVPPPPPEGGREIRQYGRTLVSQGRASIGGASVELLRAVAVVVVVPQSKLISRYFRIPEAVSAFT